MWIHGVLCLLSITEYLSSPTHRIFHVASGLIRELKRELVYKSDIGFLKFCQL